MEKVEIDDYDIFLLQVKKRVGQNDGAGKIRTIVDVGMGFLFPMPESFKQTTKEEKQKIFWSKERPEVVFLAKSRQSGITFQKVAEWKDKEPSECREELLVLLEKTDRRTVIYETGRVGEEVPVFWLEYKNFAGREGIYNLAFLFRCRENIILGTFFCLFKQYEFWKREILELFGSIRRGKAERITFFQPGIPADAQSPCD